MRKERLLIMSVGVGTKNNEKSLAHGLLKSIENSNPDKVIFIGSEKSLNTIEEIKKLQEDLDYKFIKLENKEIDDLNLIFEKLKSIIKKNEDKDIVIDYTSGTKTMTTAIALASILFHKKLTLVSGKREGGIVKKGTEKIITQNPYEAYDLLHEEKFILLFNKHLFQEANLILKDIISIDENKKSFYKNLTLAYDLWDKFNHKEAFNILINIKDERINQNKAFLGKLNKCKEEKQKLEYILIDLINNVERRMSEYKYDDAVARLYRCIELISQIKLLDYGLNDISPDKKFTLKDLQNLNIDISEYKNYANENNDKIKIGLEKKFQLLSKLGWKEAKEIYNNELKNLLIKRNNSILAHGLTPISKKDTEKLLNLVIYSAKRIISNFDNIKKQSTFIKL